MAKQTFTTGQVLTAAQMTSLQQTAMGGGSATAKTASYVLVAADAGTTVAMNAAGATTITVNTGLFAAGDTVFIQNLGAGACTVTAGTATVATAGSLILPQNDAGILYFTATGASIFYDYIQAGAVSPLTTKGDLYTFSTSDARLGVGTNTHVLTADSAEATGLKWAAPASGALTKITSASFTTQASVTVDNCFTTTYTRYVILYTINNASSAGLDLQFQWRYGSSTQTTEYYGIQVPTQRAASGTNTVSENAAQLTIYNDLAEAADADTSGLINLNGVGNGSNNPLLWGNQFISAYTGFGSFSGYNNTARDYTGFILKTNSGTMSGQYAVYGYAN